MCRYSSSLKRHIVETRFCNNRLYGRHLFGSFGFFSWLTCFSERGSAKVQPCQIWCLYHTMHDLSAISAEAGPLTLTMIFVSDLGLSRTRLILPLGPSLLLCYPPPRPPSAGAIPPLGPRPTGPLLSASQTVLRLVYYWFIINNITFDFSDILDLQRYAGLFTHRTKEREIKFLVFTSVGHKQ